MRSSLGQHCTTTPPAAYSTVRTVLSLHAKIEDTPPHHSACGSAKPSTAQRDRRAGAVTGTRTDETIAILRSTPTTVHGNAVNRTRVLCIQCCCTDQVPGTQLTVRESANTTVAPDGLIARASSVARHEGRARALVPWRCLASARAWVGCYQSSVPRRARTACGSGRCWF